MYPALLPRREGPGDETICILDNCKLWTYVHIRVPIHDPVHVKIKMSSNPQAESVIKNIIREICFECSAQGQSVSETLAAFMVNIYSECL